MEGVSKRSIRRDYRIGSEALDKILAHPEPPGYQMAGPRPKPKLGPFLGVIDEILEADKTAPPKQRHTGRRIFERLRDEYGYTGGDHPGPSRRWPRPSAYSKEVFVPLSHPPGHAQFDFGEATVEIAGVRRKAALAVMTLPYSDAYFVSRLSPRVHRDLPGRAHRGVRVLRRRADPHQLRQHHHRRVARSSADERVLTREFLRLESHFLFDAPLLPGGAGQREGPCREPRRLLDGATSWSRSPSFDSFAELNEYLAAACYADLFRRVRGKPEDQGRAPGRATAPPCSACPAESFEPRRVAQATCQLALARALRPQRLLGAHRLSPITR